MSKPRLSSPPALAAIVAVATVGAACLLTGCSDPEPELSASAFYQRAEQRQDRNLGEEPNGWAAFEAVLDEHAALSDGIDQPFRDDPEVSVDDWPSMKVEAICFGPLPREGLDAGIDAVSQYEQSGLLERLDHALAAAVLATPWNSSLEVEDSLGESMARMGQARSLCRIVRAHARLGAVAGRDDQVVQGFARQFGIARATAGRMLSIDYLVGVATVTTALRDARQLALEEALTPTMIRGILERLHNPCLPPLAAVLEAERDFALATTGSSRTTWVNGVEAAYEQAAALAAEPGRGPAMDMTPEEYFGAVMAGVEGDGTKLQMLDQGLSMVLDNERRLRFDTEATRAVLLVALYRQEHGAYPERLDAIDAPQDPIAGQPFVYKHLPEGSPIPFLLYSVGLDGIDDGGRERQGGMLTVPSPDDLGFDCVMTVPRREYRGWEDLEQ